MQVLVHLARHAGQVVPREELVSRLWPGTVVTDDALTRCIYELRRQLSQAGGSERYRAMLETLPKRGYRLNGEVSGPPPPASDQRAASPSASAQASAGGDPCIAVVVVALWSLVCAWRDRHRRTHCRRTPQRPCPRLPCCRSRT
jgi:DNA-binding winged helix-turn-helix (wHTH) protein